MNEEQRAAMKAARAAVPNPAEGVKVVSVTVEPEQPNEPKKVAKKGIVGVAEGAAVVAITIAVTALDPIIVEKIGGIKVGSGVIAALALGGWRAFSNWWKHRKKSVEIEVE